MSDPSSKVPGSRPGGITAAGARSNEVNSRSKFVSQVTIPSLTQEPAVFVRRAASSITNKQNDNSLIILLAAAAGGKNRGLKVSAVTASLSVIFSSSPGHKPVTSVNDTIFCGNFYNIRMFKAFKDSLSM